mmetsp:Transcript_3111/g.9510  ORF Transcript_3111/g.9510 Transcript_3111/m.9510 type:complete len:230 (-) Transcript_3111:491-1180(-)
MLWTRRAALLLRAQTNRSLSAIITSSIKNSTDASYRSRRSSWLCVTCRWPLRFSWARVRTSNPLGKSSSLSFLAASNSSVAAKTVLVPLSSFWTRSAYRDAGCRVTSLYLSPRLRCTAVYPGLRLSAALTLLNIPSSSTLKWRTALADRCISSSTFDLALSGESCRKSLRISPWTNFSDSTLPATQQPDPIGVSSSGVEHCCGVKTARKSLTFMTVEDLVTQTSSSGSK